MISPEFSAKSFDKSEFSSFTTKQNVSKMLSSLFVRMFISSSTFEYVVFRDLVKKNSNFEYEKKSCSFLIHTNGNNPDRIAIY